jgi:hypothetical protein
MRGGDVEMLSAYAASPECMVRLTLTWRHIRGSDDEDIGLSHDSPIVADILLEDGGLALVSATGFDGMDGACVRLVFTPPNIGGRRDLPDGAARLARMLSLRAKRPAQRPLDGGESGPATGREKRYDAEGKDGEKETGIY